MASGERFQDVPVERVMTRDPATVEPDATLSDAAERLVQGGFRHLPVVDPGGRLVGLLSERDLRGKLGTDLEDFPEATLEALSEPVSGAMRPDPITVSPRTPLGELLGIFADERVGALPVVGDDDRLVGIVSYVDLLAFLREEAGGPPARAPREEEFQLPPPEPQEGPAKAGAAMPSRKRPARRRAKRTIRPAPAARKRPSKRRARAPRPRRGSRRGR